MAFAPYACGEGLLLSKVCFVPCSSSRKQTPFLFIQGVGNTCLLNFLCLQLNILTNLDLGSDCAWIPRLFLTLIRMQSLTGRASSIEHRQAQLFPFLTGHAHARTLTHARAPWPPGRLPFPWAHLSCRIGDRLSGRL